MGEIVRKFRFCGARGCAVVDAVLDSGSTYSVIPSTLAKRIGPMNIPPSEVRRVWGRKANPRRYKTAFVGQEGTDKGDASVVVVDDQKARLAGPKAEAIIGQLLMQRLRIGLEFSDRPPQEGLRYRSPTNRRPSRGLAGPKKRRKGH